MDRLRDDRAGYSLTVWPLVASGTAVRLAMRTALVADTISIATMELVDNAILLVIPGAMAASIATPLSGSAWPSHWRSPGS